MALIFHHHPLSSCCWKTEIALLEKGLAYEARMIADLSDAETMAAFRALWPTGKIPLLQDGERIVPETSIQIEYLDAAYPDSPALLPAEFEARLLARLWDRLFDHYVMIPMQRYVAQYIPPREAPDPLALADAEKTLDLAYGLIEARVGAPWAAGADFSMADCAAAPALFYAALIRPFAPDQPRLAAYHDRLMARRSVQQVIEAARPWFRYFPVPGRMPARWMEEAGE